MRIGLYTPYLDTLTGGERYMLTIASCLSQEHTVSLFWDDSSIRERIKKRFDLDFERISIIPNIFSPKISLFKRYQSSRAFDVLFILSDGSIPLLGSKKTILHFQQPIEQIHSSTLASRIKLSLASEVICNSQFTKKYIDKSFHINSTVVYPPVAIVKSDSNKQNTILTVGRFSPRENGSDFKKHGRMIAAFQHLVDEGLKGWDMHVVTNYFERDTPAFEKLQNFAKKYPITISCDISQSALKKAYASAKIYWHAAGYGENLEKHPELAEHFGISTVEAMSAGCIPIVIDAGGQPEIVRDGENGFLWKTEDDLYEKTLKLIESSNLQHKMKSDSNALKALFGEERFCHEIHQLIQ